MNTYRITHEELQKEALRTGHKFQKAKVQLMMNVGWTCYAVESMGGVDLVMMTMKGKGTFGVVYPDGSFTRNQVGRKTVEFSWKRARRGDSARLPEGSGAGGGAVRGGPMTRQFFRVQRVSTAGTVWMLDFTSEKHAWYARRLQKAQGERFTLSFEEHHGKVYVKAEIFKEYERSNDYEIASMVLEPEIVFKLRTILG